MTTENSNNDSAAVLKVENAAEADYNFDIMDVLSEAWVRTNGLKGSFWAAAGIFFLAMFVVAAVLGGGTVLLSGSGEVEAGILSQLLMQLVLMAVMYPFMAGIMMLGIQRSVDLPLSYTSVFGYFSYIVPLIGVAVLMSLLITIGFILLIIPGIYLSLAYMFAVPLVVEKNLSVWEAMETSRKAVTTHWFKFFFLFLIMGLILMISLIPFGLGLIWTYPMMVALMGVMYRDIFGVKAAALGLEE